MPRLTVPVQLRWADIDLNGHVNNVAYLVLLEEARIRVLHPLIRASAGGREPLAAAGRAGAVVARHEVEYARQMPWWDAPVRVDVWAASVGRSSVDIHHTILPPDGRGENPYAIASTTLVYLDPPTQRSRALSEAERRAYAPLLDEPLRFRRTTVPA